MHSMVSNYGGRLSIDVTLKELPTRAGNIVYTGDGIRGTVGLRVDMPDGSLSLQMPGEAIAPMIAYLEALEREWIGWKKLTELEAANRNRVRDMTYSVADSERK